VVRGRSFSSEGVCEGWPVRTHAGGVNPPECVMEGLHITLKMGSYHTLIMCTERGLLRLNWPHAAILRVASLKLA